MDYKKNNMSTNMEKGEGKQKGESETRITESKARQILHTALITSIINVTLLTWWVWYINACESGVGDDQSPDKYESAWMEWQPELFGCLKLEEPERATAPPDAQYTVSMTAGHHAEWAQVPETYPFAPISIDRRAFPIQLVKNDKMCAPNHDRDVRNLVFDISGAKVVGPIQFHTI
jgi:hypothetical protein